MDGLDLRMSSVISERVGESQLRFWWMFLIFAVKKDIMELQKEVVYK